MTGNYSSPIVFFANGVGDSLMNLPALRALSLKFSGRATLVTWDGPATQLFDPLPWRTVVKLANPWGDFDAERVKDRTGICDLFVCLCPWRTPSLVKLRNTLSADLSVGFFDDFSVPIPLDYGKHSGDLAFDIVRWFDPELDIIGFAAPPRLPEEHVRIAKGIVALLPSSACALAVHNETAACKMWPWSKMGEVVDELQDILPNLYIFVISAADQELPPFKHDDRVIVCAKTRLFRAMAIVSCCNFFIGVDSSMLHVADIFRVPGVGLFGPTDPREFGFRFAPHRHVRDGLTTAEITVERVVDSFWQLYEEVRSGAMSA